MTGFEPALLNLLRASARTPELAERLSPLIAALLLAELLASGAHGPVPRTIGAPRRVVSTRSRSGRGRLVARSSLSGRRPRG